MVPLLASLAAMVGGCGGDQHSAHVSEQGGGGTGGDMVGHGGHGGTAGHGGHGGTAGHGGMMGHGGAMIEAGEEIYRSICIACHTIGGGTTTRAPDLQYMFVKHPGWWNKAWIADPAAMAEADTTAQQLVAQWGYIMPDFDLTAEEIMSVMQFIHNQTMIGPVVQPSPVDLSSAQYDATKQTYFNRCAGCHGTHRGGGVGPAIDDTHAKALGTETIKALLDWGTPRGMPAWGREGILTDVEREQLAAFLQLPVPTAPEMPLDQIKGTWELVVPPSNRPTAPEHARDWENFFGVVLRDPGQVAIFDGDTYEQVATIDVGFAAHILRSSSTGRYFYAVGRDGRVTLIDLWTNPPSAAARVQGCYDARSVESSKFLGFEDQYLIEGCYWPSQYVVFDGLTLEPLASGSVLGNAVDTNLPLDEVRVASIVASPFEPVWALSLKESGHVGVVDYSMPGFPLVEKIPVETSLHDGGWDRTGQYFLVAAQSKKKIAVIDVQNRAVTASIPTGDKPHPGRGANWQDTVFGWVNATTHLGEGKLSVYGTDPVGSPQHAWQVVREISLPTAGGLFIKTHDASPWVLFDMPLSSDPTATRQVCAYSKASGAVDHCFTPSSAGRAVHFEFNRHGTELWVSVWGDPGEIVIYDAISLVELGRIKGLDTPTGKFNVYNTAHDVY